MTKFVFYKRNGVFYKFTEHGHTGFGEEGSDVLCAAVSAMTMLVMNILEVSIASSIDYKIDEESTDIELTAKDALPEFCSDEFKRRATAAVIEGYFYQLNDMLEDYYDYLDVTEVEECGPQENE